MNAYKPYRKKGITLIRDYEPGEDLSNISVANTDSPKAGDKVAMNPLEPENLWLVDEKYFDDNYIEVE